MNRCRLFLFLIFCCLFLIAASSHTDGANAKVGLFNTFLLAFFVLVFVFLMGFYAGSETAFVSANKVRIKLLAEKGDKRALIAQKLLDTPEKILAMTLVGTNIAHAIGTELAVILVGYFIFFVKGAVDHNMQSFVTTLVMTPLILIFSEIIPKTIFREKADKLLLRCSFVLCISAIIFHIIVALMMKITNFIVAIASGNAPAKSLSVMREEVRLLALIGERVGMLKQEQRRMIHSVLDLEQRTAEMAMVPLVDIVAVETHTRLSDFYEIIKETSFSRIPIYEEHINNIIGLVNILDVLYFKGDAEDISPFIRRDVNFVPEFKRVDALLQQLQRSRNPMAFVVDEYGGIVGLVTIEDLVEEIIGEIQDEHDNEEYTHKISDQVIECDGRAEIDELNHYFGMNSPTGRYETIAGYVIYLMGKVPRSGEYVDTARLRISVLDADARRIHKVRIHINFRGS